MDPEHEEAFASYKRSLRAWSNDQWNTNNWQAETEETEKIAAWFCRQNPCHARPSMGTVDEWRDTRTTEIKNGRFMGTHWIGSKCFTCTCIRCMLIPSSLIAPTFFFCVEKKDGIKVWSVVVQ
jgi:hypothetical protein